MKKSRARLALCGESNVSFERVNYEAEASYDSNAFDGCAPSGRSSYQLSLGPIHAVYSVFHPECPAILDCLVSITCAYSI